jgi:hypothetical protein
MSAVLLLCTVPVWNTASEAVKSGANVTFTAEPSFVKQCAAVT